MLEIIMMIAVCVVFYRIASAENESAALWTGLAVLACVGSLAIPLPFLRVGIAFVALFVGMTAYRIWRDR